MPTLHWIGKDAVVNHHQTVPYRLLRDVPELSVGDPGTGNLIVEGDNLQALKALLPYYAGQVKCIYIDPPYNTGNEGWVYNDAVNSPLIQKWLGETVGKEAEDLSRHDKWLCMMYPRLQLLKRFLREDGAIFVSIDDNEAQFLRIILDEIFGSKNFLGQIVWQHSVQSKNDAKGISLHHNYLLGYQKSASFKLGTVPREERHNINYSNPDDDPRGPWRSGDVRSPNPRENLRFPVFTPSGKIIQPPAKGWRWSKEVFAEKVASKEIVFVDDDSRIIRKIYLAEQAGRVPESIWMGDEFGTTREANQELKEIFGESPFPTPKPSRLIERVVQIATNPGDLILDSFVGSGTTAHAVIKLNAATPEKKPRHFIGIEMEPTIAKDVTAERVKHVALGYTNIKGEKVPGLGGGFRYCRLDAPLFSATGAINPDVRFAQLARHVYFTETGEPLPRERVPNSPLIGVCRGVGVYLLFNGILGDHSRNGGNLLTRAVLANLPKHEGPKVVYAYGCLLGDERLRAERITFRQTPYEIATT